MGDFLKNNDIIRLTDYTLLNEEENEHEMRDFLTKAKKYNPAAVCLFVKDIQLAKEILGSDIPIAAVVGGFPIGDVDCDEIRKEISNAITLGADEIDIVLEPRDDENFPNQIELEKLIAMREATQDKILKVIIETPLLTERKIRAVARMALAVGVDFVKTCTGKRGDCKEIDVEILSYELMRHELIFGQSLGMKISGGISSKERAMKFFQIISEMDEKIIHGKRLRIGSSSLIENLPTI
jgi:deoxyribose-phosphate aldolase